MIIKSLRIVFSGLIVFCASAWAATPSLEGIVRDAKGHPIKGADIRIETTGGKLLKTANTDVNGRYSSDQFPAGTYRVILVVNGAVKSSINNARIDSAGSTQLNFDLKSNSAWQASGSANRGRHMVWIPAFPDSRLPGRWVEVDNSGSWAANASVNNVEQVSGEALQQQVHSVGIKRGQ
jgi:Carboxypeptidase regulatory-like domain